ncbi:MAG: hypothetical protein KY450_10005 [Actinobacteria bacterium]|nr:hypothetical protein [Actinomycetota bacterium]
MPVDSVTGRDGWTVAAYRAMAARSETMPVSVGEAALTSLRTATDATVLARMVDATILVGTAGRTTRREYQRSIELLRQVEAPLVGTVLNGIEPEGMYGYGYGYSTAPAPDGKEGAKGRGPGKAATNGKVGAEVPVTTGATTDGPIVVTNPTDAQ